MFIKKVITAIFIIFSISCYADDISLTLPVFGDYSYYHELLKCSLENDGHNVKILTLPREYNQKRVMCMLNKNKKVTLTWCIQTKERDNNFIPVEVDLTNGAAGKRFLLILRGKQCEYDGADSIEKFKKLDKQGGFGKGWFDSEIWRYNGLKYYEKDGNWDPELYLMIKARNRGVDYLTRGGHEVESSLARYPELVLEKKLMFIYERDMRFYLNKSNYKLKNIIEHALKKAKKEGVMEKIMKKYFSETRLDIKNRIVIKLKAPE